MAKKISTSQHQLTPVELLEHRIYLIRRQKVMLDTDLAQLYQVPTKRLNEAVKRNRDRFPEDFMFQLTKKEAESMRLEFETSPLRSQTATSSYGGRRYLPYAFTEHGVAMLSSVLNSARAVQMNIRIIRAFIRMREMLTTHKDLAHKIELLEAAQDEHASAIDDVVQEIEKLKQPPRRRKTRIGFYTGQK